MSKSDQLINSNDPELLFTKGGCHLFAFALLSYLPDYHPVVISSKKIRNTAHVLVVKGDQAIDFYGVSTIESKLKFHGFDSQESAYALDLVKPEAPEEWDKTKGSTLFKIENFDELPEPDPKNKWRHNLRPDFVDFGIKKAREHIEKHKDKYLLPT